MFGQKGSSSTIGAHKKVYFLVWSLSKKPIPSNRITNYNKNILIRKIRNIMKKLRPTLELALSKQRG
jgi:hypothetical protein